MNVLHLLFGHKWIEMGGIADDQYFGYRSRTKLFQCSRCGKWKTIETVQDMIHKHTIVFEEITIHDPTHFTGDQN